MIFVLSFHTNGRVRVASLRAQRWKTPPVLFHLKGFIAGLFDCPGGRLCIGRPDRDVWPCHCLWLHQRILLRGLYPANFPPWPYPSGPDLLLQAFPLAGLRAAGVWLSGDDSRPGVAREAVREGVQLQPSSEGQKEWADCRQLCCWGCRDPVWSDAWAR